MKQQETETGSKAVSSKGQIIRHRLVISTIGAFLIYLVLNSISFMSPI